MSKRRHKKRRRNPTHAGMLPHVPLTPLQLGLGLLLMGLGRVVDFKPSSLIHPVPCDGRFGVVPCPPDCPNYGVMFDGCHVCDCLGKTTQGEEMSMPEGAD